MIPLQKYIDEIKIEIDDLENKLIPNGEMVDIVNSMIMELANETRAYLKRQVYINNNNESIDYIKLNDSNNSTYRILRVTKVSADGLTTLREYSNIAISRNLSNEYPFVINQTYLRNKGYAIQLSIDNNTNNVDDSLYLLFDTPILPNEKIYIDYITNQPFGDPILTVDTFDKISKGYVYKIPNFWDIAFKEGLRLKVLTRLVIKKPEYMNIIPLITQNYNTALTKAIAYSRNFKSNDTISVQPLNFLSE